MKKSALKERKSRDILWIRFEREKGGQAVSWFVYILRCKDETLYTGSTTDLARRLRTHNSGKGAKYTRSRLPVELAYWEEAEDKSSAFRRECAIKKLTRGEKLKLIREKEKETMREMRRKERQIAAEEAWKIVEESPYGVLTILTEEGPYGVPLNMARRGDALYFHCAMEGKKTDGLRKNPGVSAVFVDHSEIDGPKLTTRYGCAMVFGEAEEILDAGEKEEALRVLCLRFAPEHMDEFERSQGSVPRTSIWKITVKHITGKANR